MAIEKEVKKMVSEQLSVSESDIKDESKIIEDLGADSLDSVEILMDLEEKFDIEITDEEAKKLLTVQDIVDFVKSEGGVGE